MENTRNTLLDKFLALQWHMKRQYARTHGDRGPFSDPSRGQGRVLAMLKMQPSISTRDLSYLLGIRQQSLNELLGKLEKAGLVTRAPSEVDRRVMMVSLTEKGKAQKQEVPGDYDLFDCLTSDEQEVLGGYLDRIILALEERYGDNAEYDEWRYATRSRMGGEQFDRLMERRDCPHHRPWGGPHHPHGGPWGHPHEGPRGDREDRDGGPWGPHEGPRGGYGDPHRDLHGGPPDDKHRHHHRHGGGHGDRHFGR